ncbi:MAG: M1 family aminopeptidase [Flavobacteriaceae bacterium]|nr:M1 family aminopeptidase [Flavobacteriaceae bacterium]
MNKYIFFLMLFLGVKGFSQTETSGRNGLYKSTPEKAIELDHTKLKVSFDFENQSLNGEEWLTASPFFYPTDSLILDAKAMLIHEVKHEGKPLKFNYKNDLLKIKLNKIYQKGEKFTIYIRYTAHPEEFAKRKDAKQDAKGLYFINPKGDIPNVPTQIWTQGEAESSSCWFPTIDKPNQKTTQEIFMEVPDKFVTLSNGILKSSTKNANNSRTDHWVMDKPHAPYLFFMGVGDFALVKDKPWRGKVPVDYYVEKDFEPVATKIFGDTPQMIEFFSQRFGYDFPWQKYAQMVVRDFVAGAMENTTAVAHSEEAQQPADVLEDENHWEAVIAHELAHHWFGNLVTAESWANITINESFANYSEYLWFEHKYGKDKADFHLMNDTRSYKRGFSDFHKHLVRFQHKHPDDVFDRVSYNKGGAILHMLRDYLGDKAFFLGIQDFLKNNEFGTGEAHQLRISFEKISGKDLNWFFNQWYFSNGHPSVKIEKTYDEKNQQINLQITQNQHNKLYFEFPLEIDVYQNGTHKRHQVWVKANEKNEFLFRSETEPNLVNINPRGVILLDEDFEKSTKEIAFQYSNAKDFKSRWEAMEFAKEKQLKDILLKASEDAFYQIRIEALNGLESIKLNTKELSTIEKIAQTDPNNLVKSAGIWLLLNSENKQKYLPIFENALEIKSASVRNAAIKGISETEPKRAKSILLKSDVKKIDINLLFGLTSVIVEEKMEKYLPKLLPYFIYYPNEEAHDPQKAKNYREGYLWAMSLDNPKYVEIVVENLKQTAQYSEKNSEANQLIIKVLNEGINEKKKLRKSPSIEKQIQILEETKKLF